MGKKPERTKFLRDFDNAVEHFQDFSKNLYEKVIIISHNDADGISCLKIIQNLLHRKKIDYDYFIYNRSVSWVNYLNGILPKRKSDKLALIFTDVGSNLNELLPIISARKEHFYILDHHEVENEINKDKIPENLIFVNPTIYGFDGLDDIAGATLTYMFAKEIKPAIIKQGWLTVIGIAGDSLKSMDKLRSFNKEIYEEIRGEELIEDNEGLILFGSMQDSIKNGLKHSILPFIKGYGGTEDNSVIDLLNSLNIPPERKIIELSNTEIKKIENLTNAYKGHYALIPHKTGILKFAFEHALLLNILSFKNISSALSMIEHRSITRYAKGIFLEYISDLTRNMKILSEKLPRFETERAIFVDAGNESIPPSNWSDTASFSTVNELLNPHKILFLGGVEKKTQMIKLSIRCSRKFLENNDDTGVNKVITRIKSELGGSGGGHKLAGGLRLSSPSFKLLKQKIEEYI